MSLTPGSRLGVFQLIALIGRGGMGEVCRATDTKLKRQVAIKILPPVAIERPSEATVLVTSEFCNDYAAVSPDGRWMAYESNVSGQNEIWRPMDGSSSSAASRRRRAAPRRRT